MVIELSDQFDLDTLLTIALELKIDEAMRPKCMDGVYQ